MSLCRVLSRSQSQLRQLASRRWPLAAFSLPSNAAGSAVQAAATLLLPAAAPVPEPWAARPFSKAAGKQKGKKAGSAPADAGNSVEAGSFDMAETRQLMARAVEHLQHELANIRTGRASPGMLDHLRVELYGEKMPLKACGTVSVRDLQLLVVTVFDPAAVHGVKKAVEESALQLQARVEGQEVLVPIPRPTAETLQAMMKVCRQQGEQAKVTVRHARQLGMQDLKKLGAEDERKRLEREVQKLTDDFVAEIDGLLSKKESAIREHSS